MGVQPRLKSFALLAVMILTLAACGSDEPAGVTTTETAAAPDTTAATTAAGSDTTATTAAPEPEGFDAEAYFAGRTVRVIVTHSAGGGSDLYGRFIGDRIGAFIPGEPRVTVTNEGGVGGMTTIFDAPEEELVVGVTSQGSALYTSAIDAAATHDPAEIQIIGGTGGDPRAVTVFGEVAEAYPTFVDATGSEAPSYRAAHTVGGAADLVSDAFFFTWMCVNLDLPCEYISVADDDSTDLNLMIQRGEINIQGGTVITMFRDYVDELADGSVRIGIEYATDENTTVVAPEGIDVPNVYDVLPAELHEDYERILPIISGGDVGKHFWAGPAMPDEVVEVLRQAYMDLVSDPAVVEELQFVMSGGGGEDAGYQYIVSPTSGADTQELFLAASATFLENLDYYEELQSEYYEAHWR